MSRCKKPPAMTPKLSIRVPAFVTDESLGLGDAVSRIACAALMYRLSCGHDAGPRSACATDWYQNLYVIPA